MRPGEASTANTITNSFVTGPAVQIGTVSGNVTIALDRPDYQVQWLGPTPPPAYIPERHRTPSRLLDTKREVVPYRNRPAEQHRLLAWLDSPAPASVLLLHGSGGRGKTRLANAFAAHCHAGGWSVAHALNRVTDKPSMLTTSEPAEPTPNVLVAVDYAERWPAEVLLALLADLTRTHAAAKLRVLLLARSIQDLWQPLCDHLDPTPVELPEPIELRDLTASAQDRAGAFREAAQAFHDALGLTDTCTTTPPEDLAHDDYASPLILHMAALAAVCASRDHDELPHRDDLSGYLLAHERRLWPPHPNASDAVFLATLFGPLANERSALTLLEAAGVTDGTASGRELLAWHDRMYPSANDLPPLLPDRFGEDYVADHLRASPRSAALVERVARSNRASHLALRRPMTVLVAAAARHPHLREVLWALLRTCPALHTTPSPALIHLAIAHAPFDIKILLLESLPHPAVGARTLGLKLATSLAEDLTDDMPARTRALLLMDLAGRIGHLDEGLANPEQVHDLMERSKSIILAAWQKTPDELAIPAADVLINSAVRHSRLADIPAALGEVTTAVEILRNAKTSDESGRAISLVCALTNQARYLHLSNRPDDSATAASEALDLAEKVTGYSYHLPNLAGVTALLADRFAEQGALNDAARAALVTARTYGQLALKSPEFYTRQRIVTLNKLGSYQALAGNPGEALGHVATAIQIARSALQDGHAEFEPILPQLLHNAAAIESMGTTGPLSAQSRAHATEALDRYRALLPSHPHLAQHVELLLRLLDDQP